MLAPHHTHTHTHTHSPTLTHTHMCHAAHTPTLTCVMGIPVFLATEAFSNSNLASGGSFRMYCREKRKVKEKGEREKQKRRKLVLCCVL